MNETTSPELDRPYTSDEDRVSYGSSVLETLPRRTRVALPRKTRLERLRLRHPGHTVVVERRWRWHTSVMVGGLVAYAADGVADSFEGAWGATATPGKRAWAERNDLRPSTLRVSAELAARAAGSAS